MGLNPDGLGRTETFGDAEFDDPAPVFDERVEDIVGGLVAGGTNVTVSYNDAGDTLTVNTSGLNEEEVEDAVGALLSAGSGISLNYNDAGDTLTVSVNESGLSFYDGTNLTADVNNSAVTTDQADVNGDATVDGDLTIGNSSAIRESGGGTINFIIRDRVGSNRGPVYFIPPEGFENTDQAFDQSLIFSLDESNDELNFRLQYSDGTVKSGTVALS